MRKERFFKDNKLPFAEARYSEGSREPFKMHLHRTLSIGAIDKGRVLYQVGDENATLLPGSLAIMNPEVLHACNPAKDQKRSYYMLYLDIDWCVQIQQSMWDIDAFVPMDGIRLDDEPLYRQYCEAVERLMDDQVHLQEKEQLLYDLTSEVFIRTCKPQEGIAETNDGIEQLKAVLSNDLHKDLPLNILAKEFSANPYTLIRRFKALTGITPHAYRMNCRIEQAKRLLRDGCDIADTALDCGFFDQSHFHRHFKSMTTVTPQEYRVNFIQ